jgi:hypothetical protein
MKVKIEDIAARVIKPDGTIVSLKKEDIFEREVIKSKRIKLLAKSFAVSGLETGSILEYQYREVKDYDSLDGQKLEFQRDIPVQRATYYLRPDNPQRLKYYYYNVPETKFTPSPDVKGLYVATRTNIPSYKEEPYSPPEDEIKKWTYVTTNIPLIWAYTYGFYGKFIEQEAKPTKAIERKTAEVIAGAANDDEKLRRIYYFVQQKIVNVDFNRALTAKQLSSLKVDSLNETLEKSAGQSIHIDFLFASMASAAGFEVARVGVSDRRKIFFSPSKYPFRGNLAFSAIAVKLNGEWAYFDPSVPYLPYKKLRWYNEVTNAIVVDDQAYRWEKPPLTGIDESIIKRSGQLALTDDGTLKGTLRVELYGHHAAIQRQEEFYFSEQRRKENLTNELKARWNSAEISDVWIDNFDDNSKPVTYTFKISLPNYAQKTGRRILMQPGFFTYASNPMFPSTVRVNDIYFLFPWSEEDNISLQLPAGFELESPDSPPEVYDAQKSGFLKISLGVEKTSNVLFYHRKFYFGANRNIYFPVASYSFIKTLFDAFYKADTHLVSLKQK